MDIKQVDGSLYWHVFVDCPHCGKSVDLVDLEDQCEHALAERVWSSKWENTGLQYTCPKCNELFILKDVEY